MEWHSVGGVEILVSDHVWTRYGERLAAEAPDAEWVLLHPDGSLTRDGQPADPAELEPDIAFVSNDVFYFGMLPVLAEAAGHYGITPAEMARAGLIGQPVHILSPLVASTYLLVGMLGLDYAKNQRFTLKWSTITSLVMLVVALAAGIVPLSR